MADDKVSDFIKDTAKGVEYFKKLREGRNPLMEGMEKAAEGPVTPPPPPKPVPPPPPKVVPIPPPIPEPKKELLKKSTGGSPPFTDAEMKQGYRKL